MYLCLQQAFSPGAHAERTIRACRARRQGIEQSTSGMPPKAGLGAGLGVGAGPKPRPSGSAAAWLERAGGAGA
jgi:hypothetical protein